MAPSPVCIFGCFVGDESTTIKCGVGNTIMNEQGVDNEKTFCQTNQGWEIPKIQT
jgi:hypothetical protein